MDTFSGDQPDDNTENRKENQLLEVATAYVVDVAGNILPRQALNPIFAAEDDIMFHIIDGQWGTVLVKAAMPARDNTPAPAVRKVTMTYNRSPFGCMQMIDGQYASIQPETAGTKFV